MTRITLILAVLAVALCGCGAELATTRSAAATPARPKPVKLSKACSRPLPPPAPSTAQPSARLFDALAVLRRPKADGDALPAAFRDDSFISGMLLDTPLLESVRHITLNDAAGGWVVPMENMSPPFRVSAACLRSMPPKQRKATRKAIDESRNRPAVEGVAIVRDLAPPRTGSRFRTDDIVAGQAFSLQGCTGPMHNRITLSGLVPDNVTQVTVTARDGAIIQATPQQNVISIERDRPDSAAGLPAHITSTTTGGALEYPLDPRITSGLDQPCEPPSSRSIGKRREPQTLLDSPKGARIELETARWQPEDTGPNVAGATYREPGRRCLLVAAEKTLRAGKRAHRFCVSDAKLRAERYLVRAARLPGGDVILEGFVDPKQASWITVEHTSFGPEAYRLPAAKGSGAFFVAIHGKHAKGGTFKLHAALRGGGPFYSPLRTVRLNPIP